MCKLTFEGHQAAVSCLHFDEMRIISGALDRLIKIWNMVTGEVSKVCTLFILQEESGRTMCVHTLSLFLL